MPTTLREPVFIEGADACARLRASGAALEAWQDGDAVQNAPACKRTLRVLIAEDERDTADTTSLLLTAWGHEVRLAYDGAAALDLAAAYEPDVLLLDIAMPKMDGCRLAQQLRRQSRFRDTLLIAMTGYADKAHRLLCEEAGFDFCLIKPVDPSTVERLLQREHDRLAQTSGATLRTRRPHGVLVVDDEDSVRGVLDIGMRQQGFAVWLAADGREALEVYRRHGGAIDVVLVDVRMPGRDGPQTLAALREVNPEVRCCFMSGDLGGYTEEGLRNLGAAALFRKPFRLAEVSRVLRELAGSADLTPTGV
jgi:CheY-like chemotaxis protein